MMYCTYVYYPFANRYVSLRFIRTCILTSTTSFKSNKQRSFVIMAVRIIYISSIVYFFNL